MDWLDGLASNQWKTKVDTCLDISLTATLMDAAALIPALSDLLFDAKLQVKDAALVAIRALCDKLNNKDLEPLIPKLIDAMCNPNATEETIYALSATTFVQPLSAASLTLLVPLLKRGLTVRAKACQRKACVIIENMAKLVEDPEDVKVFLPQLVPLVTNVKDNSSDPDNRSVAERSLGTLERVLQKSFKIGGAVDEVEESGEVLCECNFSLAYGAKILLKNARLYLKRGKRYGLCGPNGVGKSTLLRAISNGQVDGFPNDTLKTIYMEHDIDGDSVEKSIFDYVFQSGNYTVEAVVAELVDKGFGTEMHGQAIQSLSGGWKMKLALVRAMLQKPDILLLDEPTNHLDVGHVAWLQDYLCKLENVSCIIVSHDSGFLDVVCTHILHYIDYKLHLYPGNLTNFVKLHPEAQSYYELEASLVKFKFPEPGFLEGVKTKDKAILKMHDCSYKYPGTERWIFKDASVACSLNSRVAVLGPNGAGKSTLIKLLMGELETSIGTLWRHPNLRIAYVAQHAFYHLEKHLDKSPMEYMQWRYATGEDREKEALAIRQISEEEQAKLEAKFMYQGEKRAIEMLVSRRKDKKSYEYEVKWKNFDDSYNSWFSREDLETMGFHKWVQELDQKEATRLGMVTRPLTAVQICQQFEDLGLEKEIAMHSRMAGLSGGQNVKVVLATAMWLNPHVLVMDEPTNYLDRDSLGALAHAIKNFGGGVIIITHHNEFSSALCKETWNVRDGVVAVTGAAYERGEKLEAKVGATEVVDAYGNVTVVEAKKTGLSSKEKKKLQKLKEARRKRGEVVSSDEED
jgi:elongation factor 3